MVIIVFAILILSILAWAMTEVALCWLIYRSFAAFINSRPTIFLLTLISIVTITIYIFFAFAGWLSLVKHLLGRWSTLFVLAVFTDMTFALWLWKPGRWFEKYSPRPRSSFALFMAAGISLMMCSAGAVRCQYKDYYPHNTFTPEKWQENVYRRCLIVDDLMQRALLNGKHKAWVEETLGKGITDYNPDLWEYEIGSKTDVITSESDERFQIQFRDDTVFKAELIHILLP